MRRTPRGSIRTNARATSWDRARDDLDLARFLRLACVRRLDDVVVVLEEIDARLPEDDGLKWTNRVFLARAEEMRVDRERGCWASSPWLEKVDVDAARLYFDAVATGIEDRRATPRAWRPVLEQRDRRGVSRAQFALAGLMTHVQHDLPLAIVRASQDLVRAPRDDGPERRDYERLRDVVSTAELAALRKMASGMLAVAARVCDERTAHGVVRRAREQAWRSARALRGLGPSSRVGRALTTTLGGASACLARTLLVRTEIRARPSR